MVQKYHIAYKQKIKSGRNIKNKERKTKQRITFKQGYYKQGYYKQVRG